MVALLKMPTPSTDREGRVSPGLRLVDEHNWTLPTAALPDSALADTPPAGPVLAGSGLATPRRRWTVGAHAHRIDHCLVARNHPTIDLTVFGITDDHIEALSDTPLLVGERLAIHYRSAFMSRRSTLVRVTRCRATDDGYALTFGYEPLPAA